MLKDQCDYERQIQQQQMIILDLTHENMQLRMALRDLHDPPKKNDPSLLDDLPKEVVDMIEEEARERGLPSAGVRIIRATYHR